MRILPICTIFAQDPFAVLQSKIVAHSGTCILSVHIVLTMRTITHQIRFSNTIMVRLRISVSTSSPRLFLPLNSIAISVQVILWQLSSKHCASGCLEHSLLSKSEVKNEECTQQRSTSCSCLVVARRGRES